MIVRGEVIDLTRVVCLVPRIWARSPIMPASSMALGEDAGNESGEQVWRGIFDVIVDSGRLNDV